MAQVSGETDSPYGYNAEAVDTNTGLQYLRARYYNSSIGGFLIQNTDTGCLEDPLAIHIKSEPTKTVKTTAGISDYLHFPGEVQVESEVSVDPVTQSLENRYGEVTTKTDSYAYAGGLFVTAFGEAERI
ncbi:RHS repeat-associated protein, partial [Lachnotalea glycerini]